MKPSAFPTITAGLGIGHGLLSNRISSSSSQSLEVELADPSVLAGTHLFLLLIFPSGPGTPSWYVIRGAGHGSICGRPTTAKEAASVPQKIVPVILDRGCMFAGGIVRVVLVPRPCSSFCSRAPDAFRRQRRLNCYVRCGYRTGYLSNRVYTIYKRATRFEVGGGVYSEF